MSGPKRFCGEFRDNAGVRRSFYVEALSHGEAESFIDLIGSSGFILGELIAEGECETLDVGVRQ